MVFRRLERMLYETGLYFGVPAGATAGIYEIVRGAVNCDKLSEAVFNPQFQTGAAIYALSNAAGWLLYKFLNRSVVNENLKWLNSTRSKVDEDVKRSKEKAQERAKSPASEPEKN